jgi:hypothetical protein
MINKVAPDNDFREAASAFLEKRCAKFAGK